MSIPPENIPFWPQMTTDFTSGSLSALCIESTIPCLTAALHEKKVTTLFGLFFTLCEILNLTVNCSAVALLHKFKTKACNKDRRSNINFDN